MGGWGYGENAEKWPSSFSEGKRGFGANEVAWTLGKLAILG